MLQQLALTAAVPQLRPEQCVLPSSIHRGWCWKNLGSELDAGGQCESFII